MKTWKKVAIGSGAYFGVGVLCYLAGIRNTTDNSALADCVKWPVNLLTYTRKPAQQRQFGATPLLHTNDGMRNMLMTPSARAFIYGVNARHGATVQQDKAYLAGFGATLHSQITSQRPVLNVSRNVNWHSGKTDAMEGGE